MWGWFERHWCWIGLAAAVVLLIVLLFTNVFRNRRDVSRIRLNWLNPLACTPSRHLSRLVSVLYLPALLPGARAGKRFGIRHDARYSRSGA